MTLPQKIITAKNNLADTIISKMHSFISAHNSDANAHSNKFDNYVLNSNKSNHAHGNINASGQVTTTENAANVNRVVVTDSSGNIKTISTLPSNKVTHQDISRKLDATMSSGYAGQFLIVNNQGAIVPHQVDIGGNYTGSGGIDVSNQNVISHSNSITPKTASGLYLVKIDGQGHITEANLVQKENITSLGIPGENTTYTAGTGLTLNGTQFKHTNNINSKTTQELGKFSFDSEGHITGFTKTTKNDIVALGIPSSDTNTTYSAGTGLNLSGTTFSVENAPSNKILTTLEKDYTAMFRPTTVTQNNSVTQAVINEAIENRFEELFQYEEIVREGSGITSGNWAVSSDKYSKVVFKRIGYIVFVAGVIYASRNLSKGSANMVCQFPSTMIPGSDCNTMWVDLHKPEIYGKIMYWYTDNLHKIIVKPFSGAFPKDHEIVFNFSYFTKDFLDSTQQLNTEINIGDE